MQLTCERTSNITSPYQPRPKRQRTECNDSTAKTMQCSTNVIISKVSSYGRVFVLVGLLLCISSIDSILLLCYPMVQHVTFYHCNHHPKRSWLNHPKRQLQQCSMKQRQGRREHSPTCTLRMKTSSASWTMNEPQVSSAVPTPQFHGSNQRNIVPPSVTKSTSSSTTSSASVHNNPFPSTVRDRRQIPADAVVPTMIRTKFKFLHTFPDAVTLNSWIQALVTNSTSKHRIKTNSLPPLNSLNNTMNYTRHDILPLRDDIDSLWSMNDHVSFLLAIGEHSMGTVPSIINYVRYVLRLRDVNDDKKSVDIYLAAFQALNHQKLLQQQQQQQQHVKDAMFASRLEIQAACMNIVKIMKKNSIITSSKVMAILLPLFCGYTLSDPIQLHQQLLRYYPNLVWSDSIWVMAIQACSCDWKDNGDTSTTISSSSSTGVLNRPIRAVTSDAITSFKNADAIWEVAEQLYDEYVHSMNPKSTIKRANRYNNNSKLEFPSEQICVTMLQLCVVTKNITNAAMFVDRILHATPPEPLAAFQSYSNGTTAASRVRMTPRLWAMFLKVCAVAGDHKMAYEVLCKMGKYNQIPNVRHCTAFLKALIESNELDKSFQFLSYMSKDINPNNFSDLRIDGLPDMIAVKTVLNGCVLLGNYTLARQLCDNIKKGHYGDDVQMDEQCFNMLLSTCHNSTIAKEILREIRLTRRHRWGVVRASAITYTKAIAVCRKSLDVENARSFLLMARNDGIPPDLFMYSSAIWVAAQCNDAEVAMDILNEMIECNTAPTIVSYNGVFAALASTGNSDVILATFQDMKRRYSHTVHPNFMSYFHITRCLQKVKEDEERLAYLWRVYALMGSRDRQVNVGGCLMEALIQTYGALGHFDEAMEVFESISGLSNSACLRAILFACSEADPPEWEKALSLLHASDIVDGGVGPGLVEPGALCNAMLACSKAGKWEESLQLMRLHGEQSELSIVAVNSLIAACGRAGRPDMSMEVLYEVEGRGMTLDTRSYRSTIIACNQAEHDYRRSLQMEQLHQQQEPSLKKTKSGFEWWECAISLLRRMKESGLQPDTPTLSSTISACEAAGQWQRALYILQSAMNDDATVALNVYCFNAAISACEKGGAWVEALEIYEKMKQQSGTELRPNLVTVSSLILALDNAGQKEFAINIYREGLRKRFIPSPWRMTKGSNISDEPIMAMDLHSYSAAMTRAAIRHHMNALVSRPGKSMMTKVDTIAAKRLDWTIIVGQGYHSIEGRPILKDTVLNLFSVEYGIDAVVDDRNFGRIQIPADSIRQFISKRRW